MKLKFNSMWVYISAFIYLLIKIIEYSTGEVGSPAWVIDLMPFWLPLLFFVFDNFLTSPSKTKSNSKSGEKVK